MPDFTRFFLKIFKKKYCVDKFYNHGQNIEEKFKELSKIGFSLECFTADFWHFSSTIVETSLLGWVAG